MSTHIVGIADMKVSNSPGIITTIGLGSCVGVTMYDPTTRVGGLLHVLLPSSNGDVAANPAKYADTGIPELLRRMVAMGARRNAIVAKMAGGANMFSAVGSKPNIFMVGQRNIEMCLEVLRREAIKLARSDTGGNHGRTIELDMETGQLKVKTIGQGQSYL